MGRKKANIDWDKVGKMLEAGAFARGIAATIGIDEATLYRRCERDNKISFATLRQQKVAQGDEGLRTVQYDVAMGGDKTMLIWLGKQRLGQSDKSEVSQTIRKIEVHWLDGDKVIPTHDSDTISDSIN